MKVIIIGAGWAGLAAAVELCHHHCDVTILEAASLPGGRARRVNSHDTIVDNGQHLMIGAYHHVLQTLQRTGANIDRLLLRQPLTLSVRSDSGRSLTLTPGKWPAPWHLVVALLTANGLDWRERWQTLRFCRLLSRNIDTDITVLAACRQAGQDDFLIRTLWQPLCLAILNTAIDEASFAVFRRCLLDGFTRDRRDCEPLFARVDLGTLFVEPCHHYIESNRGQVLTGHRVTAIDVNRQRVTAVTVQGHDTLQADHFILALPPVAASRLLQDHALFSPLTTRLQQFDTAPICTIYLQFPPSVRLEQPMVGLTGGLAQWLFDRSVCGQAGLLAVVISGQGPHMSMDNETLIRLVQNEVAVAYPDWPAAADAFVLREKRATFACRTGINDIRPGIETAAENLWLAGDHVNTGYPSTLEGAVISGVRCAQHLLQTNASNHRDPGR